MFKHTEGMSEYRKRVLAERRRNRKEFIGVVMIWVFVIIIYSAPWFAGVAWFK